MQAAPGMSAEGVAAIIAAAADASGGVPIGATAPDAAATLPPTEPMDPADVKDLSKDHQQEYKAVLQIRKKYCLKDNPIAGQPPLLYRNMKAEGSSVC
ncbi:hypothetical protein M885DRAFT_626974, partial [Pelagophyceae sp. CCMP2097]